MTTKIDIAHAANGTFEERIGIVTEDVRKSGPIKGRMAV